jgi:hypothetical protein
MATLLVALVIVCALGIAVQVGRGLMSRGRSVKMHRQALDTLADITQSSATTLGEGEHPETNEHQAHVRLLGPAGETASRSRLEGSALPPPRALSPASRHNTQSPFRRPARSTRAGEAGAGGRGGLPDHVAGRRARGAAGVPPIAPAITPPERPIGEDDVPGYEPGYEPGEVTRAIPGLTPPPPEDPATKPVPVIRPHVFYFDDLSPRTGPHQAHKSPKGGAGRRAEPAEEATVAPAGAGAPETAAAGGGAAPRGRQRRLAAQALVAAALALVVAGGAVYVALNARSHLQSQAGGGRGTSPISKTSTLAPSSTAGRTPTTRPATSGPTSRAVQTSTTAAPTTTLPRRKPVVLLSAIGGTDTYQLTSKTASIVVTASGPCWVEVRAGSSAGQVVTEQTLQAGQAVKVTGPAWIRLGDPPYAKVSVDGSPTTVPGARYGVPLNLDFTIS